MINNSPPGSLSPLGSDENVTAMTGNSAGSATAATNVVIDPNLIRPTELFAPKCIVLLARHQHFKVLQV